MGLAADLTYVTPLLDKDMSRAWRPRSTWENPVRKLLRPVSNHAIDGLWNDDIDSLRSRVIGLLAQHSVEWHAIDVLRIEYVDIADRDAPRANAPNVSTVGCTLHDHPSSWLPS